jgi:AraC-like DNA-binding protein
MDINNGNIFYLTEKNQNTFNLPLNKNFTIVSKLKNDFESTHSKGYSLKLYTKKKEIYTIDKQKHILTPNNFLLINKNSKYQINIEEIDYAEGICIYFEDKLIHDLFSLNKCEVQSIPNFKNEITSDFIFTENIQSLTSNKRLNHLVDSLLKNISISLTSEFFYLIAEAIVESEKDSMALKNNLSNAKKSTKDEILRRLNIGTDFLSENYTKNFSIKEAANVAFLSEFYFIRLFKQVFKITPYKYVLTKRLEKSVHLLSTASFSIGEIAEICGFSDIYSFSKTFKSAYKVSPSQLKKSSF